MSSKAKQAKDNQHFVPQFCLRHFAVPGTRGRAISSYRISTGKYLPIASIEGQASGHKFYQTDELDDMLTEIETAAARVVANAVKNDALPAWRSKEHITLLVFAVFQALRTPAAAAEMNEGVDKFVKNLLPGKDKRRRELEDLRVGFASPAGASLMFASEVVPVASDLRCKLLRNRTSIPLIMSDHPAVLYNQLLEKKQVPGGITGFACMGLEVFLPLSPRHLLLFYDCDAYKIGGHRHKVQVEDITAPADVRALNCLQAANASDHLYFNGSEFPEATIRLIAERAAKFRRTELTKLESFRSEPSWTEPARELVAHQRNDIRMHLNLRCVRIVPSALAYDPHQTSVHLRRTPKVQSLYRRSCENVGGGETAEKPGAMLQALAELRAKLGTITSAEAPPAEDSGQAAPCDNGPFNLGIRVSSSGVNARTP